ncbi:MAG: hypothetical protein E7257_09455 [Lachnospiraceae bacterium]|nr:hypothetical protein [Lachnospiraceae bacterium]
MRKTKRILRTLSVLLLTGFMILGNVGVNITLKAASGDVAINETNFPDPVFRNYISDKFDKDGNKVITQAEINKITDIRCGSYVGSTEKIQNLKGIEYFTEITYLFCDYSNLEYVDISHNTKLTHVHFDGNNLKEIDLSNNKEIIKLWLSENELTTLDVSMLPNLKELLVSNNQLTQLDVSKNTKLHTLRCSYNDITELNLNNCKSLGELSCDNNEIKEIDLSENGFLYRLYISGNPLTKLDISNNTNLEYISCTGTDIEYLYVGNNSYLTDEDDISVNDDVQIVTTMPSVNISYRTHIQSFGWEGTAGDITTWKSNGAMSGTSGKSKRLESINIVVDSADSKFDIDLGIQYTTHCQSYGWLPWSANGEMNGTEGEAKRLEAIMIKLTGFEAKYYDVYYRVHAQSYGWLGWAKNGAPAGTAGYGKRLEGIQIVVVKKGESFNQKMENITSARTEAFVAKAGNSPIVNYPATSNTTPVVPGADTVNVAYRTHVQSFGWQGWKYNGQMSGTSGKAKRLEGINIELRNQAYPGDIVYTTHVQKYGWQGKLEDQSTWKKNGEMSGTSGEAKRLEAICINLTCEMSQKYDIYYRVHAQSYGWLGWAKNGEPSGTAGYGKRLEGIQIVLVPKGGAAPGNYQGITSDKTEAYVQK